MQHSREPLLRVVGQMDSDDENVRLAAFGEARDMLRAAGITFADLAAAHIEQSTRTAPSDRNEEVTATVAKRQPARDDTPPAEAYLHEPRALRWTREVDGKRVIRGTEPPQGVPGRLRILKGEPVRRVGVPRRRLTMSFETADAIYEPFVLERHEEFWLKLIRQHSATGASVIFE